MKLALTVKERLMLMGVLPTESNFVTLKIVRKLMSDLSFTEEEHQVLKFETVGQNSVSWNHKAEKEPIELEIGEKALSLIIEQLKTMDEKKKLTESHFTLYEKIMEQTQKED